MVYSGTHPVAPVGLYISHVLTSINNTSEGIIGSSWLLVNDVMGSVYDPWPVLPHISQLTEMGYRPARYAYRHPIHSIRAYAKYKGGLMGSIFS